MRKLLPYYLKLDVAKDVVFQKLIQQSPFAEAIAKGSLTLNYLKAGETYPLTESKDLVVGPDEKVVKIFGGFENKLYTEFRKLMASKERIAAWEKIYQDNLKLPR